MVKFQVPTQNRFLEENQQELAELATFVDFAVGLTIGFIEINNPRDADTLLQALRDRFDAEKVRFMVMDFSRDRDLRFLRDAVIERLPQVKLKSKEKLVLVIRGLEVAIGTDSVGDYPPVLQDLNFVRDAYAQTVAYPLLFVLPDYAITRVAKYAPDFWAWQSGLFSFKTSPEQRQALQVEAFEKRLSGIASNENEIQIQQLMQLLMEYQPSGKPIDVANVKTCSEIYYKLGSAYITQRQPQKAIDYLNAGVKLLEKQPSQRLEQRIYHRLGRAYEQLRQFDAAQANYEAALGLAKQSDDQNLISMVLQDLGDIALERRQFEVAKDFYQQSLTIDQQQNDRYSQASTYHQLGMVAQALREFPEARNCYQQALQIKVEFGDRYSQASTYFCIGSLAEAEGNPIEARANFQQALERYLEFNDEYWAEITKQRIEGVSQSV
jgi:tetratricopeptide (TPR) repeat protein